MIWNDAEYMFRLSPVTRRAACPADSPRRMGSQTSDCAKEGAADIANARIGSAWQAVRISPNPHLNRSGTSVLYSSRVPALSSHPVGLFGGRCTTRGGLSTTRVTPWPHLVGPPLPSPRAGAESSGPGFAVSIDVPASALAADDYEMALKGIAAGSHQPCCWLLLFRSAEALTLNGPLGGATVLPLAGTEPGMLEWQLQADGPQ